MEGDVDPIALDEPCPACGGARTFHYEDERVVIECDSCEATVGAGVPPGAFAGYDREAMPGVAARYFRSVFQHIDNGFCWFCHGRVEATVDAATAQVDDDADLPAEFSDLPFVYHECEQCGAEVTSDLGSALRTHPAVVGFHYDRGVDVRERPFWDFSAMDTDRAAIEGRDPFRAGVRYSVDGETLRVVVDDELAVLEAERVA